uniref:GH3-9 n=1 Tax=Arundo donax TaxID=35708 RepID=A0A0A8YC31_ARUDO
MPFELQFIRARNTHTHTQNEEEELKSPPRPPAPPICTHQDVFCFFVLRDNLSPMVEVNSTVPLPCYNPFNQKSNVMNQCAT